MLKRLLIVACILFLPVTGAAQTDWKIQSLDAATINGVRYPDASVADHGNAATVGSAAWCEAQLSGNGTIVFRKGTYAFATNWTPAADITVRIERGVVLDVPTGVSVDLHLTTMFPEASAQAEYVSGDGTFVPGTLMAGSGGGGGATVRLVATPETFIATEGQAVFTLSNAYEPDTNKLAVFVNGVKQVPTAYEETDANTVTLSEAVGEGTLVECIIYSWEDADSALREDLAEVVQDKGISLLGVPGGVPEYRLDQHTRWVTPEMFGALGGVNDDTAALQAAIDAAVAYGIPLVQNQTHYANVAVTGALRWLANLNGVIPVTNNPAVTINAGAVRTVIDDLNLVLSSLDRGWTNADGIRIVGEDGTEDYTTFRNLLVRGAPGFGLVATGSGTSGNTVQRLHVYDSTIVDSGLANLRLEGVVLEAQFVGCFLNDGCKLGASPAITDQTTHGASPTDSRSFRRGAVEILRWYTAANTAANDLTPNRINFIGCNFVPSLDWLEMADPEDKRVAALYIAGGQNIHVVGSNFEKPYPAVWLAKEGGTGANYGTSSAGVVLDNCTFLVLGTDDGTDHPIIDWEGYSGVQIRNPVVVGAGGASVRSFIRNRLAYPYAGNLILQDPTFNAVTFTENIIERDATAYSPTRLIANARYLAHATGVNRRVVVGKASASHPLHALSSQYLTLVTNFYDGEEFELSCDTTINGSLTVVHDADDGEGAPAPLNGRFLLAGAVDATLDAAWKRVRLSWDAGSSVFRELWRNF